MIWGRLTQKEMYDLSDKLRYTNLVDEIAYKKTIMYMGNGIEFKHEDKKIHEAWHELEKRNNLYDVMFKTEELMGRNGVQFISLNVNEEGKALLNMCNPWFPQFMNKCFANGTAAVIYECFNIDNKLKYIRSFYDTEKVVRSMYDSQNNIVNLCEFETKLPEEYRVQLGTWDKTKQTYTYYHNLGFVPVFAMVNKPFPTSFFPFITAPQMWQSPLQTTFDYNTGGYNYASLKDTAYCTGLVEEYEQLRTLQLQNAIIDKTRAITYGITQNEKDRTSDGDIKEKVLRNMILDAGYGQNVGGIGQNGATIEVLKPSNNLTNYDDTISNLLREIYRLCGLSYLLQTSTQKTSTESYGAFKESLETLYFMQQFHTKQWKNVIEKMFKAENIDLGDDTKWSFQVKKNTVIDEANKIDNMIKKLQAGAVTVEDIIADDRQIDSDQSKQVWKEIYKWFKDNKYQIQMQEGKGANGVGTKPPLSKEDKGGRPTQKGVK